MQGHCFIKVSFPNRYILCCQTGTFQQENMTARHPFSRSISISWKIYIPVFYTEKAAAIAKERQGIAVAFYNKLYQEINTSYKNGIDELNRFLQ